jgi:PTH1 family peptidyl-tRNA hydrolase
VKTKFQAELLEVVIAGEKALLLSPVTYMNRSGGSVQPARDFYQLPHENLLIICDDINLPLAKLRFRVKGSAGGQKGLADILQRLGTDEVPRLRVGIGEPPDSWDAADYVLGRFSTKERSEIRVAMMRAADAVEDWVAHGIETCMNQYNG